MDYGGRTHSRKVLAEEHDGFRASTGEAVSSSGRRGIALTWRRSVGRWTSLDRMWYVFDLVPDHRSSLR